MNRNGYGRKRPIAFLCIVLVFACTLFVFLPHAHDGCKTDCPVCRLMESSRELLLAVALLTAPMGLAVLGFTAPCRHCPGLSLRDGTPVGLKVKLSD